jgi:hypothetical protein
MVSTSITSATTSFSNFCSWVQSLCAPSNHYWKLQWHDALGSPPFVRLLNMFRKRRQELSRTRKRPNRNAIIPSGSLAPSSLSLLNIQSPRPPTIDLFTDQVTTCHEAQELGIQVAWASRSEEHMWRKCALVISSGVETLRASEHEGRKKRSEANLLASGCQVPRVRHILRRFGNAIGMGDVAACEAWEPV